MIEKKKKLCNNCNTEQFIWKNDKGSRYCKNCWYRSKEKSSKPLQRKPINKKSKKMAILDSAYTKLRKRFMEDNPMCQAALPGCNHNSTDVHHKKGRGTNYLTVSTWMSVCRQCHTYIEEHPAEAIELGFSLKRT
jgi:hypothetical protein